MESLGIVRERLRLGELKFASVRNLNPHFEDGEDDFAWAVRRSGLPAFTIETMRLEHWEQRPGKGLEEALEVATAMARGDDSFCLLTLAGPPGVGKTFLAIAIGWEWLLAGALVVYRQVENLLDELRSTFNLPPEATLEGKPTFDTLLKWFKGCQLLVLDDLGVEKPTEWAQARLDSIIDHRWLNLLPLVVTTNLKGEDLPPRILDRLQDWRCGRVVQIPATSYRRRATGAGQGAGGRNS